MNTKKLIASSAGIALLIGAVAPALAFAEEGTSNTNAINTSVTNVTVTQGENENEKEDAGEHRGLLNLPKLKNFASTTLRIGREKEDGEGRGRVGNASSTANRIATIDEKSGVAIDKRIKDLQDLLNRLAGLKLLAPDVLASIQTSLNAEIQTLTTLKTKIGTDTSTTTIKADADSITKANRVYLLVMPKAQIASASSRINAVVTQLQALATKLQGRITAAQTAGTDVSAAVTALADYNAKITDAKTEADAAVAETANLVADNGNATILASNNAALKDARTKLQGAEADLKAARTDAKTIVGIVKGK